MEIKFGTRQLIAIVALILLFIFLLLLIGGYRLGSIKLPGGIELKFTPPADNLPADSPNRPHTEPPDSDSSLSPDAFIRGYYSAVNSRDYQRSWAMLSDSFKTTYHCCNDDGTYIFSTYEEWWDSMAKVDILNSSVRNRGSSSAEVSVALRYTYQDGTTIDQTHLFYLVLDDLGWQIEDQE